ncbi:hypothetical protein J6590_099729 [Homalodisca vitripennis]|nr:hypothetical protein J6590_099729 [Homalodisca vitripennis]
MPGFTTDQSTGGYVQNNYYNAPQNSYYNAPQVLNASEEVHQIPGYNAEQQHLPPENSSQEYWTPTTAGGWDQQSTPVQEQAMVEPTSLDSQPQISVKPGFGYFANSEENVKPQTPPKPEPVSTHYCCHHSTCSQYDSSVRFKSLAIVPSVNIMTVDNIGKSIHPQVWSQGRLFQTLRHGLNLFGSPRQPRYVKPKIVFGGTYPIDLPLGYRRRTVPTFDIDLPVPVMNDEASLSSLVD